MAAVAFARTEKCFLEALVWEDFDKFRFFTTFLPAKVLFKVLCLEVAAERKLAPREFVGARDCIFTSLKR